MALSDTRGVGWGMGLLQLNLREATSPPGPRRKGTNTSPPPCCHRRATAVSWASREASGSGSPRPGAPRGGASRRRSGRACASAAPRTSCGERGACAGGRAPPPPGLGLGAGSLRPAPTPARGVKTPGRVCEPPPVGGEAGTSCGHSGHEPCPAGPCPPPRDAAASPDHAPARLTAACGARCPQENVPVPDPGPRPLALRLASQPCSAPRQPAHPYGPATSACVPLHQP